MTCSLELAVSGRYETLRFRGQMWSTQTHTQKHTRAHRRAAQPAACTRKEYLLRSRESMVEAGNVSHDGSFIRFGSVDNVWGGKNNTGHRHTQAKRRNHSERREELISLHRPLCFAFHWPTTQNLRAAGQHWNDPGIGFGDYIFYSFIQYMDVCVWLEFVCLCACAHACVCVRTSTYIFYAMCAPHTYSMECLLRSEDSSWESFLSCHQVEPRDQTRVIRLIGKCLYLLNHLASPRNRVF